MTAWRVTDHSTDQHLFGRSLMQTDMWSATAYLVCTSDKPSLAGLPNLDIIETNFRARSW